jgi:tellurite resistance protein TerC
MGVPGQAWLLTVVAIAALVAVDFYFHVRRAHVPALRESALWSALYVGIAIVFGLGVAFFGGGDMGAQYFAGWITEKALSVDNLFVFLIVLGSFKVPRADQEKALLFGIVFALVVRTGFIFLGSALIESFAWVFYLFGLILLITAGNLLKTDDEDERSADNVIVRVLTPMLLVMVVIGGTDVLFALDSIPAIFGLTQNVYLVFTATAFSLLGLRQLYFLLDGLLDRLIYLSYGLAAILALIGVKLILHALHENNVPFVNSGEPVDVVEISTKLSLGVIVTTLFVTVVASLLSPKGRAQTYVAAARRHADEFLNVAGNDPVYCDEVYHRLVDEETHLRGLPERYRARIHQERELMDLLAAAHRRHDEGTCFTVAH